MTTPITPSQTAAAVMIVNIKSEDLVMLGQAGFTGVEVATVEASTGLGFTQIMVADEELELSVSDNVTHLRGPGKYRISKPLTANPAHLFIYAPTKAIVEVDVGD